MSQREQTIEAFYFANSNNAKFNNLISEFPEIFSSEKIVPINFQLHSSQIFEELHKKRCKYDTKKHHDKLSNQSTKDRFVSKKVLMLHIVTNKDRYPIFSTLASSTESQEERIWIYIDTTDQKLKGPFTSDQMHTIFKKNQLVPETKIKKLLDCSFSNMANLLQQYCKIWMLQKLELGHRLKDLPKFLILGFDELKNRIPEAEVKLWMKGLRNGLNGKVKLREEFKKNVCDKENECVRMTFNKAKVVRDAIAPRIPFANSNKANVNFR